MPRINAVEEIVDLLSDLGSRILLKEMTTGNQLRSLRMWQQILEARGERLVIEDLVLPSPDQQRREFRFLELMFEPLKPLETTCSVIKRNPARPSPGEQTCSRIRQDALVDVLCLVTEFLSID